MTTTRHASGGLVYSRAKVSWAIRFLTQFRGEQATLFNHVFVLRRDGTGGESLPNGGAVELHDYLAQYDNEKCWGITFAILDDDFDHGEVECRLDEYISEAVHYDTWAIAKCAVDGFLSKLAGRDVFLARHVYLRFWKRRARWHICSWLFAYTHLHGGHAVVGRVTRYVWRRLRRITTIETMPLHRITPDDIGDDVVEVRPSCHIITSEFGVRPPWLETRYPALIARLARDLSARS